MFWSGAGISGDAPTCLPLGDALTQTIVDATCRADTWRRIRDCFDLLDMRDDSGRRKTAPRLEAVIEQLDRRGQGRITRALAALADPDPNDVHDFFARHLAARGTHVTMNFDERIEASCARLGTTERPLALHGRVTAAGQGSVRTRVSELARGLDDGDREAVERRLRQGGTLVFVGYSGRDYFDVDPFFRSLVRRQVALGGLQVIWVMHIGQGEPPRPIPDWRTRDGLDGTPVLECLADLGASVRYECMNTRAFLRDLAARWGITPVAPAAPGGCPSPTPAEQRVARELATSEDDRRRYTADLCAAMAFAPPILDIEAEIPDEIHARVDAHSRVGRYRTAIGLARRGPDRAQNLSVVAALQRIRGAYVRSLVGHVRALRAHYARDTDAPALRGSAQVEYLNWYSGARRTLLRRPVALGRRLLAALLPSSVSRAYDPVALFWRVASETDVLDAHPHAVSQLERVHREVPEIAAGGPLPEVLALRYRQGVGAYVETDSVIGYVNEWRGRLRAEVEAGGPPDEQELRLHLEGCVALCDRPGIVKAQLLLRYAGYASALPARALWKLQWTPLTRLIYLARWVGAPAQRRLRRGRRLRLGP